MGDRVQGYWCAYALDGICDTIYCVDCRDIKKKKEELQMSRKVEDLLADAPLFKMN